ncbi:MAG TPA: hypothetical protein H9866_06950 [Candidatus Tidjanibacter gallistercoris]|nr:hypothetical protein [Candidatus Tidjanibacter gallistercoris]
MSGWLVKIVAAALPSLCCMALSAQEPADEGPYYDPFEDDFREITVDTTLFYTPLGDGGTVFSSMARYGFGFTSYRSRGWDERFARASLDGLELSSGLDRYPDYHLYTALAALAPQQARLYGVSAAGMYSPLFTDFYDIRASLAQQGLAVTYTYSEKRYRNGMRFRAAGRLGRGWHYALAARGRWGEDAFVRGVFTDAFMGSVAVEKRFRRGASLALFLMAAPQQRGMKGWTEREAYDLTGDYQYNPYWGPFEGRVRNSRVRRDFAPMAVVRFGMPGKNGFNYTVVAGVRAGYRSRSGLSWSDANSPAPDYHANLPGHRTEPHVIAALEEAWRSGDVRVTQVDWTGMYDANLFASDGASLYTADRRMERIGNWQVAFTATGPEREGFGCDYGVRMRRDGSRFYRIAADLLGGRFVHNRDPFTGADSDIRNPGRRTEQGGRYDYDYDMVRREVAAFAAGHYRQGRFGLSFGAQFALADVRREGHYEKETLPGSMSYGTSAVTEFVPYNAFLSVRYAFTAGHRIAAELYAGEYTPHYGNMFLSPDYSNALAEGIDTERVFGAQAEYRIPVFGIAAFEFAAYAMYTGRAMQISRYYDDLYGLYCDMVMSGIARFDWGVEAGVRVELTERLALTAALSAGNNVYRGDPELSVLEDATGRVLLEGDRARLDGFVHSATPQTLVAAALTYAARSQWGFSLEWMYAGRRYVTVNPLRRTDRFVWLAASPEERQACFRQERLPDAWVLNVGVTKGFTLFGVRVFASVSVDNLLGRRDIVYGGYEQMRFDDYTADGRTVYRPFPSRYNYAYPRTLLASLTVSF